MRSISGFVASASIGGLVLLCNPSVARPQGGPTLQPVSRVASITPGSIRGVVHDEGGAPLKGVTVSVVGATPAAAVTDQDGRFELRTLSPGPYLLRARLTGFVTSPGQMVDVRPSGRTSSMIALRRLAAGGAGADVLEAGIGASAADVPEPATVAAPPDAPSPPGDDSEIAWRLRHARRSVLREATIPDAILVQESPGRGSPFAPGAFALSAVAQTRAAVGFLTAPLSGQVNLFATGSFDSPQELFRLEGLSRNVAYMSVGAPAGDRADWAVRGALTQGDVASWILAGSYLTRPGTPHQYNLGVTYSAQRYDVGSSAALVEGSRNAASIYGFDTWTIAPAVSLTYGGRYARYDYLSARGLASPKIVLSVLPAKHLRISAVASQRALAPGAEEFLPPSDDGFWLPPQRTFSSLAPGSPLQGERVGHLAVEVERDFAGGSAVSVRVFHQQTSDQLLTMFGVRAPDGPPTALGHYLVADMGNVDVEGWSAGFRSAIGTRVRGAAEYTLSRANWNTNGDLAYMVLLAPSVARLQGERIHDLSASIEANVPETATRVVVLCRISNAFAGPDPQGDRAGFDSRFDVQVRQSLPFMNFSTARWEMLIAVRNFFHETAPDQSVLDELLVVRPPKRIVGGLSLRF